MEIEDYTDPQCPFCTDLFKKNIKRIPIGRIIEKLDSYFAKNDYDGALSHLLYWLAEAEQEGDLDGVFTVKNELMGLYRKIGKMDKAIKETEDVLELLKTMDNETSVSAGTAYLNAGTAYKAYGNPQKSITYFEKAKEIYEKNLEKSDSRMGGLYNNMALTLTDLGEFEKAYIYYDKAINVMMHKKNGLLDCAISYLNIANAKEAQLGLENAEKEINALLEKAQNALDDSQNERDGYYAFVCEKCAPTFGYYGFFLYEKDLKERAKKIYERS
ncbi:MAG: tetratricopeptide repeat protein [Firmicutes bacterium]|nr:tetratricopeptide repeat protein [Bacillota bacterium]